MSVNEDNKLIALSKLCICAWGNKLSHYVLLMLHFVYMSIACDYSALLTEANLDGFSGA